MSMSKHYYTCTIVVRFYPDWPTWEGTYFCVAYPNQLVIGDIIGGSSPSTKEYA